MAREASGFGVIAAALLVASGCSHAPGGPAVTARDAARRLVEQGQPGKAIPILSALHRQTPGDLGLARALVEAYVRAGRAAELIAELSRGERGRSAVGHYMLGLAHFARSRDPGGPGIRELQAAIALAPGEAELHYRLGLGLLDLEQYDSALPPLERAVKLAPARAGMILTLARARHRAGDSAGAVAALGKLVVARPERSEVLAARELMEQIADPFAALPASERGALEKSLQLLHEHDAPQQAIASLEEIAHEHPNVPVVYTLLALAYERLDDDGTAVDELRRAIDLAPLDGKSWYYLGEVYLRRVRTEQARQSFQRAVELNPLLEDAYFRLGDLALEDQDPASAQGYFQIAATLSPDSVPARGKLALALQLKGDFAGAERELRELLRREPESVEFKLRMGALYLDQRSRSSNARDRARAASEATLWLREVLKAEPDHPIASRGLQSIGPR